ncbi:unnamed protein product [Lactuca virosa]|uniref:Uncharacterized protein n=1 Tax=Lactuca virosa TaxID=75947 RepID=A0AAU9MFZ6_9ASTR|nr:unnamed protein product [Lactuca virosa]
MSVTKVEVFEGKNVTLLDRLRRKRFANTTLEEVMAPDSPSRSESSMDSAVDVSQSEGSRPIPPNPHSKGVKSDVDCGEPPTVFTRTTSKGLILKKRSESVQVDQLIKMSPPK